MSWFGLLLFVLSLIAPLQEAPQDLPFDLMVEGTISDADPIDQFRIIVDDSGPILVSLRSLDRSLNNLLHTPVLSLGDADGDIIADTTLQFTLDDAQLIAEIDSPGDYFVTVTRAANVERPAHGDYSLIVTRIETLDVDEAVPLSVVSDQPRVYQIQPGSPFDLVYRLEAGDFTPQIAINRLEATTGGLRVVSAVYGAATTHALLGTFDGDAPYYLTISPHEADFRFEPAQAEITLTIRTQQE